MFICCREQMHKIKGCATFNKAICLPFTTIGLVHMHHHVTLWEREGWMATPTPTHNKRLGKDKTIVVNHINGLVKALSQFSRSCLSGVLPKNNNGASIALMSSNYLITVHCDSNRVALKRKTHFASFLRIRKTMWGIQGPSLRLNFREKSRSDKTLTAGCKTLRWQLELIWSTAHELPPSIKAYLQRKIILFMWLSANQIGFFCSYLIGEKKKKVWKDSHADAHTRAHPAEKLNLTA